MASESEQVKPQTKLTKLFTEHESGEMDNELSMQNSVSSPHSITSSNKGQNGRRASTGSSLYKEVTSKLYQQTTATINGQWKSEEMRQANDSPSFNSSTKVSPEHNHQDLAGKHNPYDQVQSRLLQSTAATEHGKWKGEHGENNGTNGDAESRTHHSMASSPKGRRFSTGFVDSKPYNPDGEIINNNDLAPRQHLYDNVESRLMKETTSVKNSKWQSPSEADEENHPDNEKPKFEVSSTRRGSALDIPLPPPIQNEAFRDIKPRFQEWTTASENRKWVPPPEKEKDVGPAFVTNAKGGEIPTLTDDPHEWTANGPYKNVSSRLFQPTAAYTNANKKKVDTTENGQRKSLPPTRPLSSQSRLVSPTCSSRNAKWDAEPVPPPEDAGKPLLIKSKVYSHVESRLLQPTTSSINRQYVAVKPPEEASNTAFGHPIEDEYRNLSIKSPVKSRNSL